MCRKGGRRCEPSQNQRDTLNKKRRVDYWKTKTDSQFEKIKEEWGGETPLDLDSPMLEHAYKVAVIAHAGERRKTGDTFINHPLRVAKFLQDKGFNNQVVSVAILHDAVEDSDLTLHDLQERHGFPHVIVRGVDSVTKRDGEEVEESVQRAADDPIGRLVKLSDNLDNSAPEQINFLTPRKRLKAVIKYTEARKILWESIYGRTETKQKQVRAQLISVQKGSFSFTQW